MCVLCTRTAAKQRQRAPLSSVVTNPSQSFGSLRLLDLPSSPAPSILAIVRDCTPRTGNRPCTYAYTCLPSFLLCFYLLRFHHTLLLVAVGPSFTAAPGRSCSASCSDIASYKGNTGGCRRRCQTSGARGTPCYPLDQAH